MHRIPALFIAIDESDMLPCLSRELLGMDCPGCGLQRAVALLLQGRIGDSFLMYPALIPMLFLFGFIAAERLIPIRKSSQWIQGLAILTVGAILINFVLKLIA